MKIDTNSITSNMPSASYTSANTEVEAKSEPKRESNVVANTKSVAFDSKTDLNNLLDNGKEDNKNSIAEQAVIKAIEEANKKLIGPDVELNIKVHEETKKILVKMIDKETGDTIREFPSEKLMDILYDICNPQGKLIDVKR